MQPRLELMPLGKIRAAKHNPKQHDIPGIMASIRRFGFVDFPTMNEKTGRLVEGHGRQIALKGIKRDGPRPKLDTSWPPANVVEKGKSWLVPVIRGLSWESDQEAAAYLAAHNQLTRAAGWDDDGLAALLADVQANSERGLEGLGFEDDYVTGLLAAVEAGSGEIYAPAKDPDLAGIDNVPDLSTKAVTKPGDVWTLGKHRLVCGDSTDPAVVLESLDGAVADLLTIDPPYGVGVTGGSHDPRSATYKAPGCTTIQNDDLSGDQLCDFLTRSFKAAAQGLAKGAAWYIWYACMESESFMKAARVLGGFKHSLVWVKPHFVFGRADYHYRHEPCLYGWTPGAAHTWLGNHNQTTVFEVARGDTVASGTHPSVKPVALYTAPIENHLHPRAVVLDTFAGTGPAFSAAEVLDRQCCGVELDPAYCDVIIERWETLTGGKATRQSGPPKKTRKGRTRVTRTTKATA